MEEVAFNEVNYFPTMLGQLADPQDEVIDHIHRLRGRVGADIVSMFVESDADTASDGGRTCGRGYVMQTLSSSSRNKAFNVVVRGCAATNHTFAHELGHNMGLQHNHENADSEPALPYGFGYRRPDPVNSATNFRTIMAVQCEPNPCPRIPYFLNPGILHNGVPIGVTDPATEAARALNDTRCVVAAFGCHASCDAVFEDCRACVDGPPCPSVITCAMSRAECRNLCQ